MYSYKEILYNSIIMSDEKNNNVMTFTEAFLLINSKDLIKYQNEIKEKDLLINNLKKEKESLYEDIINKNNLINKHETRIKELEQEIEKLEEQNKLLKEKIEELEIQIKNNKKYSDDEIYKLKEEINLMKKEKNKFDALVKLHECNAIVNKTFKMEYKKRFNPKRGEIIPNIGEIINNPPSKDEDEEYYNFWEYFKKTYPGSDDIRFRKIYLDINNDRANNGAHVDVTYMEPCEVDQLIILAYPEKYKNDPNTYKDYREWLFKFPAI
jgi:DNA repair exonuclease SbcCD ATPase subunit